MGPELWIVAGVIVLLFGGSQLPKLARSLGEAKKEFESGQGEEEATKKGKATDTTTTKTETVITDTRPDDEK